MKYTGQNLAKAFLQLAKENKDDSAVKCFIDFCKEKRLGYLLPNFLKYLKLEAERQKNIETLKIISSVELDGDEIKEIKKMSGAPNSEPAEIIKDKNIVAGFISYYQNKIIDASLDSNLSSLKNKLIT